MKYVLLAIFTLSSVIAQERPVETLKKMLSNTEGKVLFGHQSANLEGRTNNGMAFNSEELVCDTCYTANKFPAVSGYDFHALTTSEEHLNYLKKESSIIYHETIKNRAIYKEAVLEAYELGSIPSFSWHAPNPMSDGLFNDNNPKTLREVLRKGSRANTEFKKQMDIIVDFALNLKDRNGDRVPFIFRPFHEHNGHWFWWCQGKTQDWEGYVELWRYTIDYLRERGLEDQMLIAYSPNKLKTKEEYLMGYPGDEYVDILGLDYYAESFSEFGEQICMISNLATNKNKLAALTETGKEGIPSSHYWTRDVLKHIATNKCYENIAYALWWRNADEYEHHYYVPYPKEKSVWSFRLFSYSNKIKFLDVDTRKIDKDFVRIEIDDLINLNYLHKSDRIVPRLYNKKRLFELPQNFNTKEIEDLFVPIRKPKQK